MNLKQVVGFFAATCLGAVALLAHANPVNINTSDAEVLAQAMSGVGVTRAEAIVAYRTDYGPFQTVDDLVHVKGIGTKLVDINRDQITVENPTDK